MKHAAPEVAIRLTSVTKKYTLHHEKPTLVEKFVNGKEEQFLAIKNLSLEIKKGERVGIMGPNGSGKTTLLKIIAGISTPTSGTVYVQGRVVSLIDLEAGFHPDLTGEQNIYLSGMILGINKREIKRKLLAIIRFADVGQFIDAPLFTYSSGMKLKLGFSIAIHAKPRILVLDEGLGAGDAFFRKKAQHTILNELPGDTTIIISAHNADIIVQVCNRILIMNSGSIIHDDNLVSFKKYARSE